jgi:signal transduction histidine kinase/FixJ family two-component response regulator
MEKTLLLVDDEADIREILGLSLADLGYRVLSAENGLAALDQFRRERPPVVVTDIKMPGLDGIGLLREIKKESPDTEVIMITGHGDLELAIHSLKHEATDFITKPIHPDMLEVSVGRAWEKASMRAEIRRHNEHLQELVRRELEATRYKYHLLFEAVPCFISVIDRSFRITERNRLFKDYFGGEDGIYCYKVVKHRDAPCADCPVAATFEDGEFHQMETVVTARSGRPYDVLIHTAPIRDAGGEITHVMEVATDITAVRELQDRLTSLGLLIGSVSHGIKGLLTGLDGGMYLMNSGLKKQKPEQVEEGREILETMVGRLRKQVMDILHYAKDRELERETVDAAEFAGDVADTVVSKAEKAGVIFEQDIPDGLGALSLDPGVASAALVNILENAVEACADDRFETTRTVSFRVRGDDHEVVFEVADDGPGMDRETRERMFTLFFSSKGNKGTGLGLFIAHRMVKQHGGDIQVDSEPGQGATFTVRLPRKPAAESKAADPGETGSTKPAGAEG